MKQPSHSKLVREPGLLSRCHHHLSKSGLSITAAKDHGMEDLTARFAMCKIRTDFAAYIPPIKLRPNVEGFSIERTTSTIDLLRGEADLNLDLYILRQPVIPATDSLGLLHWTKNLSSSSCFFSIFH